MILLLKECSSLNYHATSSPNCSFLTGNLIGIHDAPNIPLEMSNILDNMVMSWDHYPLPNEDSYSINDDWDNTLYKHLGFREFQPPQFEDLFTAENRLNI